VTLREEHRFKVFGNKAEEYIWTWKGGSDRKLKKTAYWGAS